jgi:GT2 family glycosyltransferase
MTVSPRLRVAICTRNRRDSLLRALRSLERAAAHPDAPPVYVAVVDNGSDDGTAQALHSASWAVDLDVLREPRIGLSRARNAAIAHMSEDWLVFTDDDAEVSEGWLAAIAQAIRAHPDMQFFGGRTLVRWSDARPSWLSSPDLPFIQGLLCHFDAGSEDRPIAAPGDLPFGVNMGLRRDLVDSLAPFRVDLGAGTPARGEDTEYLSRALEAGFSGWYLADAVVHHHVDTARFGLRALYHHGIAKGHAQAQMQGTRGSLITELQQLLLALAMRLRGKPDWMRVSVVNAGLQRGLRRGARGNGGAGPATSGLPGGDR